MWLMLMACSFETAIKPAGPLPEATGPLHAEYAQLTWSTHAELEAKERQKAAAELREPKPPSSAWVGVAIVGTKTSAEPDDYLVVVRDASGAELLRQRGEGRASRRSSELGDEWTVMVGFSSRAQGEPPLHVYLIDTREATRQEWEVTEESGRAQILDITKRDSAQPAPAP